MALIMLFKKINLTLLFFLEYSLEVIINSDFVEINSSIKLTVILSLLSLITVIM